VDLGFDFFILGEKGVFFIYREERILLLRSHVRGKDICIKALQQYKLS